MIFQYQFDDHLYPPGFCDFTFWATHSQHRVRPIPKYLLQFIMKKKMTFSIFFFSSLHCNSCLPVDNNEMYNCVTASGTTNPCAPHWIDTNYFTAIFFFTHVNPVDSVQLRRRPTYTYLPHTSSSTYTTPQYYSPCHTTVLVAPQY